MGFVWTFEICLLLFLNSQHPLPTTPNRHLNLVLKTSLFLTLCDLGETVNKVPALLSPGSHVTQRESIRLCPSLLNFSAVGTKREKWLQ